MKITFKEREFTPETRQVSVDGKIRHLRPKEVKVLLLLCDRYPEPVSRQTLEQEVWPQGYVSEQTINQTIRDIRCSLGDSRKCIIVTHPRQGYALGVRPEYMTEEASSSGKSLWRGFILMGLLLTGVIFFWVGFSIESLEIHKFPDITEENHREHFKENAELTFSEGSVQFLRRTINDKSVLCTRHERGIKCAR